MRAIGKLGGERTKQLAASRPGYYAVIGAEGGRASSKAQRERFAAGLRGLMKRAGALSRGASAPKMHRAQGRRGGKTHNPSRGEMAERLKAAVC